MIQINKKESMKKNMKYIYLLSLQIFVIFTFAMIATYFSEFLSSINFFGDHPCNQKYGCGSGPFSGDENIAWGSRHYWYAWMCFLLFTCSLVRSIIWSVNYWVEELNN